MERMISPTADAIANTISSGMSTDIVQRRVLPYLGYPLSELDIKDGFTTLMRLLHR